MGNWNEDTFIMCRSYVDAIKHLELVDRCKMFETIADYGLEGIEPTGLNAICSAMFALIKPLMDATQAKREKRKHVGGAPQGNQNASKRKPKTTANNSKQLKTTANNSKQTLIGNSIIVNSKIDNSELLIEDSESTRTQEIIDEYQAVEHTAWHESLAMTYRLERADVLQCIEDGVHYCVNMGIDLTRSNVMRYTKTACERYKPALKPLQDRKTAFASECKALKADANLIGEFYEYYTQPMRDNDDCMLFESFRSWNTATRFKQFLNRKQHGN